MATRTTYRESTSIPYEIKVILDSLEMSDERPQALSKWAKKVFTESRKLGRTNEEIAEWIEDAADEKDYSERQIRRVLKDNGYTEHPEKRNISKRHSFNYIGRLKDLTMAITGLDDQEIKRVKPGRAAVEAQSNILHIAAVGSEAEKSSLLHYTALSVAVLSSLEKALVQKAKGVKLEP